MEMTHNPLPIGAIGTGAGHYRVIAYSLVPDKLWLVTLLEGLALACFIWAFATHFDQVKRFSSQRSMRMGANSAMVCPLSGPHLSHLEFPRRQTFHPLGLFRESELYARTGNLSRSPQSHLRRQRDGVHAEKDPGYQGYKERFDSYRQTSPKLTVQFIDPERQPKVAQNYGVTRTDVAIFENGLIGSHNVASRGGDHRRTRASVEGQQKRVVFLEGHGERSLEDKDRGGMALTKEVLEKQGTRSAP